MPAVFSDKVHEILLKIYSLVVRFIRWKPSVQNKKCSEVLGVYFSYKAQFGGVEQASMLSVPKYVDDRREYLTWNVFHRIEFQIY